MEFLMKIKRFQRNYNKYKDKMNNRVNNSNNIKYQHNNSLNKQITINNKNSNLDKRLKFQKPI